MVRGARSAVRDAVFARVLCETFIDSAFFVSRFVSIMLQSAVCGVNGAQQKHAEFDSFCAPILAQFQSDCRPFFENGRQRRLHNTEQFQALSFSVFRMHGVSATSTDFTFEFLAKRNILDILIELIPIFSAHSGDDEGMLVLLQCFLQIAETSLMDLDRAQSALFLAKCVNLMERINADADADRDDVLSPSKMDERRLGDAEEASVLALLEFMATRDLITSSLDDMRKRRHEKADLKCGASVFKSLYFVAASRRCASSKGANEAKFYEVLSICIRSFTATFATKLNCEQRNAILGDSLRVALAPNNRSCDGTDAAVESALDIIECFAEFDLANANGNAKGQRSHLSVYLEQSLGALFRMLVDVQTPKLQFPKLCSALLPVLIAVGRPKMIEFLQQFIPSICKHSQRQQQKVALKFEGLIAKVAGISKQKKLDYAVKAEFRTFFIALAHQIRHIVTVH